MPLLVTQQQGIGHNMTLLFFNVFIYLILDIVKAREKAMTQNESGHNMTKG